MMHQLPDTLLVLERGWLSANNVLGFTGNAATVIDSGYVTHAPQTVDLITHALAGRRLEQLINTHSHSDHIGGNAALQARFDCRITVPAGLDATIAEWDEAALLLSPLDQQGARFQHDALIAAGDEFTMGELNWQALAVPGHDMDALAYYNPEQRILIAGDALWENGFGLIFPTLLGSEDGLAATRETLEMLGRLPLRLVIPGHGRPFADAAGAIERGLQRLARIENDGEGLAWHGIRTIASFALLEKQRLPADEFHALIASLPFTATVNRRFLQRAPDEVARRCVADLLRSGAIRRENGWIAAA